MEYIFSHDGLGLAMGGAVFQAAGSVGITNSSFAKNQAVGGNGSDFVYTRPSPAYGGALAATGGILSIDHDQFGLNQVVGGASTESPNDFSGNGGVAYGGAIYCAATAKFCDSSFFENQVSAGAGDQKAASGCGGGVYNAGNLELIRCAIYSNSAAGGAGIFYDDGVPSAGGDALGAGIFNTAQLAITNCTIALNSCTAGSGSPPYINGADTYGANGNALGGGIYNTNGTLFLMNVTVASNSCTALGTPTNGLTAGLEVANTNGALGLLNSILAYSGTNANAYGPITDDGYNMCSDGSANLAAGSSFNNTDPQLAPLADYGGPTLCMALLPTSPAIDHADPADFPTTDQRGYFRPVGAGPDMGAYEFGSFPLVIPALTIAGTTTNALLSFTAAMPATYCLQTSTNLTTWVDVCTNGPFASTTNVTQSIGKQGYNQLYFRLHVK